MGPWLGNGKDFTFQFLRYRKVVICIVTPQRTAKRCRFLCIYHVKFLLQLKVDRQLDKRRFWRFLPRDVMHTRGLCRHAVSVCLYVCVCVCLCICHVRELCQNE